MEGSTQQLAVSVAAEHQQGHTPLLVWLQLHHVASSVSAALCVAAMRRCIQCYIRRSNELAGLPMHDEAYAYVAYGTFVACMWHITEVTKIWSC